MLDEFDYKEPRCTLCSGEDFYYPNKSDIKGRIPIKRIIEKVDSLFNKNDLEEACRLLNNWKDEALSLNDKDGELSIINELIGYYRKANNKEKAYQMVNRANELIVQLKISDNISKATILLNIATAYNAFGDYKKGLEIFQKTLEIYTINLEKNDDKFSGLYNNMAYSLHKNNKFEEAENYYKKAISINKFNNNLLNLAITYVNLAHLYYDHLSNAKEKIVDCLFKAYEMINDEKNDKNGYYAYVLEKCAPSFKFFGFDNIEKEFLKNSKDIYERT